VHRKRMTMQQVLDLAATPRDGDSFGTVEAARFVTGGARSTHLFCFNEETPVRKRRRFDHCVEACDAWETVSEKRLMADYGDVTWWVVHESSSHEPPRA
jgi:hypothetical protein